VRALPARRVEARGAQAGRPSRLVLEVNAERHVHVTGDLVELGRGTIRV
jgi:predicted PhzF superfamily epimerase YddE/YHI9